MSRASALLAGLAALLLVVVVGNPPANDAIRDQLSDPGFGPGLTSQSTTFLSWDVFDRFGDLGPAAITRALLFVVLAALLGGIVGRSPKVAALIGGWGAGMIAAIVASVGFALVIDPRFAFPVPDPSFTDRISLGAQRGAVAGVLPSLLIAVAVAIGARPRATVATATPGAAAPAPQGWDPTPGAPAQDGAFGSPVPGRAPSPPPPGPGPAPAPVAAPAPPDGAPAPQWAPPVAPAPAVPPGGPAVGAPPPRSGTTQPAPGTAPAGPVGAADETQKIQLPPS